jgi:hypothetical protein
MMMKSGIGGGEMERKERIVGRLKWKYEGGDEKAFKGQDHGNG